MTWIREQLAQWFPPIEVHPDWGVILAVLGFVAAVYRWTAKFMRSMDDRGIVTDRMMWNKIVSKDAGSIQPTRLKISFDDQVVEDVLFLSFTFGNYGSKVLSASDFNEDFLIELSETRQILDVDVLSSSKYLKAQVKSVTSNTVTVGVDNWDIGHFFRINLVVDSSAKYGWAIDRITCDVKEWGSHAWPRLHFEDKLLNPYNNIGFFFLAPAAFYAGVAYFMLRVGLNFSAGPSSLPKGWAVLFIAVPILGGAWAFSRVWQRTTQGIDVSKRVPRWYSALKRS